MLVYVGECRCVWCVCSCVWGVGYIILAHTLSIRTCDVTVTFQVEPLLNSLKNYSEPNRHTSNRLHLKKLKNRGICSPSGARRCEAWRCIREAMVLKAQLEAIEQEKQEMKKEMEAMQA